MVFVKVSETYDLSTKVNKMGFIGIHTPKGDLIARMWSGLVANHKFVRFVKCDVDIACASILPADPLQVGVEAGQIAPQDMFNPILYTAVSNDSMSNILGRIYKIPKSQNGTPSLFGDSVDANNDLSFKQGTTEMDQFKIYYAQLANTSGWRKAMPQQGLSMHGLFPICYTAICNYGMPGKLDNSGAISTIGVPPADQESAAFDTISPANPAYYIKGNACRMPRFPTTQFVKSGEANSNLVGSDGIVNSTLQFLPPVYVGAIIMPPAKLSRLYYRLKVTWTIEFSETRPSTDILNWSTLNAIGGDMAYASDYINQTKTVAAVSELVTTESVDASDMDIEKVMESV